MGALRNVSYMGMYHCKGMIFKQFSLGWGIEIKELCSRIGRHFPGN